MSPESVAIATFREITAHRNGAAQHVHIAASATVAAQAEFWYEEEREQLAEQIGAPIEVYVDPAAHPERPRVVFGETNVPALPTIRVGDEFEVELLTVRLPNATSAAAVVAGRLVEVENAANAAGKTIKIRILDVDGTDILAEPRTPIAEQAAEQRAAGKRRRRGGRGRKHEVTAAEEAEELRELAEEAKTSLGGRATPPIGISTHEETAPKTTAQKAADGVMTLPGEKVSGPAVVAGALPGERLSGDRVGTILAEPPPQRERERERDREEAAEGNGRRGRRRRRRRGGRPGPGETAASTLIPTPHAGVATIDADVDEGEEEAALEHLSATAPETTGPEGVPGERRRRRRRRRRRGRGPGGPEAEVAASAGAPEPQAVPDRHIFRVDGTGAAQPTGETAPPAPSRAIAPWNRRRADVAVEPPPPVLAPPQEPAEPVKAARPSRRRRAEMPVRGGQLEAAAPIPALPAPQPDEAAPKRRTRKAAAETAEAPAPKRTRRTAAQAAEAEEAPKTKTTTRARKTSATAKTSKAKASIAKTTARKATAKKSTAAKKATSTRKTSSAKKTSRKK
jgi:ribonuclease E